MYTFYLILIAVLAPIGLSHPGVLIGALLSPLLAEPILAWLQKRSEVPQKSQVRPYVFPNIHEKDYEWTTKTKPTL